MLNTIIMYIVACVFAGFWLYLAWDAHKEVKENP